MVCYRTHDIHWYMWCVQDTVISASILRIILPVLCALCLLCSERFEWDTVDTILDMAREHLQGFAVITVSSAEVKIVKGTTLLHSHEKL